MNSSTNVVSIGDPPLGNTVTSTAWLDQSPAYTQWYQPYYSYPVYQRDQVAELKAWLDGYMESGKLTEKKLARIQKKLEEFTGAL